MAFGFGDLALGADGSATLRHAREQGHLRAERHTTQAEGGNIGDAAVSLAPGASHTMRYRVRVESLPSEPLA
jgi:hypothetical protein